MLGNHYMSALIGLSIRDIKKFSQQKGRLFSAIVRPALWLFVFAAGSLVHILLDSIFVGQVFLFYPFFDYSIGLELISKFPSHLQELVLPILDALLLFFWIFWMQFKLKIDDYF